MLAVEGVIFADEATFRAEFEVDSMITCGALGKYKGDTVPHCVWSVFLQAQHRSFSGMSTSQSDDDKSVSEFVSTMVGLGPFRFLFDVDFF